MCTPLIFEAIDRDDNEKIGGVTSLGVCEDLDGAKIPLSDLMTHEAYRNVITYCVDYPKSRLILVEVSSLEEITSAPFLDRSVRRYATGKGFGVPLDVASEWAHGQDFLKNKRIILVWNTGRCGSTLMHRALVAAGAVSASEPFFFDQMTAPWCQCEWKKGPDVSMIAFACSCMIWHQLMVLVPDAKVFAMNGKGFFFKAFSACLSAFPPEVYDVRHMQMYRDTCGVVNSFGSLFFPDGPPPPDDSMPTDAISSVLQTRLAEGSVDLAFMPKNAFSKGVGFDWADSFCVWKEFHERSEQEGKTFVVSFKDFCTSPMEEREIITLSVLDFCGLPKENIARTMQVFAVDSQEGSHMAGKPKKKFLDDEKREELKIWVKHLIGVEPDVKWPGDR